MLDGKTGLPEVVDADGSPIESGDTETQAFEKFTPWETSVINGQLRPAGLQNLFVPMSRVVKQYPTPRQLEEDPAVYGGYLPRLIYADVLAAERKVNPNAKGDEAWGWLPPPLVGEGRKVQPDSLHKFLLDPFPIRPAVVLRMPRFNMSSNEASTWSITSRQWTTSIIPMISIGAPGRVIWRKRKGPRIIRIGYPTR